MRQGVLLVAAAILVGVAVVAVQIGVRFVGEGWTIGTLERLWFDPGAAGPPIGYEPPDLLAVQRRLLGGRFDELDTQFRDLQQSYLSGNRPELEYVLAYQAFLSTSPEIGAALDRWVATDPESAAALTARAKYRIHVAWWKGEPVRPELTPSAEAQWRRDEGLWLAGIKDLETAVAIDAQNLVALADLVWVAARAGEKVKARNILDRGLAIDPFSYVLHNAWIGALLQEPDGPRAAGDYVESIRDMFERKPLLRRLAALVMLHHAKVLAQADRNDEAIDLLFEAGAVAESANLLRYRADLLQATGQRDWAEADLDRALIYLPHHAGVLAERAELYARTGRAQLAERDFSLALELDSLDTRTLWKRAGVYYSQKRYREAEADFTHALLLRPDDPTLRFQRGFLRLEKLDDAAAAAEDLAVAAERFPDSPNVWRFYVRALTDLEDCRAVTALSEYRRSCDITEADECGYFTLRSETRRVEKMAERMSCPPSG